MDKTITFSIREEERDRERKMLLRAVYDALSEKGYNPINQIVGYILTEDPTYITNYKNARGMIRRIDRDELMGALLEEYLDL
ncbi:MAG: IreB family regulatory phosphoprotein [Clostridia bacterium]|nr:IreB family regulatory phosphoprotein [Clostridia bacterium]